MNTSLHYADVLKQLKEYESRNEERPVIRWSFLSNVTLDMLFPYVKLLCFEAGLRPQIAVGGYDTALQDASNGKSGLYAAPPDVCVVALRLESLAPALFRGFGGLSPQQRQEETSRVLQYVVSVVEAIRRHSAAPILVHGFESPLYPALGILDFQSLDGAANTVRALNLELIKTLKRFRDAYVVDVESVRARVGQKEFFDARYWHIGRAPYAPHALEEFAAEYMKFVRACRGRVRKCLVLDCDNTLWGGVAGEDGPGGVLIGKTFPGSAYHEFQEAVRELARRGVLLALCSRNNPQDVQEVFAAHADMPLRWDDFVSRRINWNDKVSNLREIAKELNIGLDSLVFMDDSEFEVAMVNKFLPEVAAVRLPEEATSYRGLLESCGLFDSLEFTDEDRRRNEMYAAEQKRQTVRSGA
ncbi:MAG TPA: HAD-IIIC family phosphatase, partial [Elusimicrobiota bacterium]|nr:HAD-IIIC family phosphatase [Elusimicrobiota bacterium]